MAFAEGPRKLNSGSEICDSDRRFCIRGSIWYRPNTRRIEITGRIARSSGPGWVSIIFRGTSRTNQPASAIMEFPVRGTYSEIIDRAFIPDEPQIGHWRIERLYFEADDNAARAAEDQR